MGSLDKADSMRAGIILDLFCGGGGSEVSFRAAHHWGGASCAGAKGQLC
jgi:hypothetical protein